VEKDGEKSMKLLQESLLRTTNKINGISISILFLPKLKLLSKDA